MRDYFPVLICVFLFASLTQADDKCLQACASEVKSCIGTDFTKFATCTKNSIGCSVKCVYGADAPKSLIDCAVSCATTVTECTKNAGSDTTKQAACLKTHETCGYGCAEAALPPCLKGAKESPALKCVTLAGANPDELKSCGNVELVNSCLLSECGSVPSMFSKMMKLDEMSKKFCGNDSTVIDGGGGMDPCHQACGSEIKSCIGTDLTKAQTCTENGIGCSIKCLYGADAPKSLIDCSVSCATTSKECTKNAGMDSTKHTACLKTGNTCSQGCTQAIFPPCLKGAEESPAFKCVVLAGGNPEDPKSCADVNKVVKCLSSKCGGMPDIFVKMMKLDEKIKKLCPTRSPTVIGGTMGPTSIGFVAFTPTAPPTAEVSAAATLPGTLQLAFVLIAVVLMH